MLEASRPQILSMTPFLRPAPGLLKTRERIELPNMAFNDPTCELPVMNLGLVLPSLRPTTNLKDVLKRSSGGGVTVQILFTTTSRHRHISGFIKCSPELLGHGGAATLLCTDLKLKKWLCEIFCSNIINPGWRDQACCLLIAIIGFKIWSK
jgi:hypothetical protein